jgi:cytochrome c
MTTEMQAGNEPPEVSFDITGGNRSFFFPNTYIQYAVKVNDKEDGSLADGSIDPQAVSVTIDYLEEGYDQIEIAQGHQAADQAADRFAAAKALMAGSDCMACHQIDRKSIGPMYIDVAKKYKDNPAARDYLTDKIINGGSGVWGDVAMSAHPTLTKEQTSQMVEYILSLADQKPVPTLPVSGRYRVQAENRGVIIARAAYTDKGANGIPPIRSEETLVLRAPTFSAASATIDEGVNRFRLNDNDFMIGTRDGAYIGFENVDLTDVGAMTFIASAPANYGFAGGVVEVHIDSPTGPVIGTSNTIVPTAASGRMGGTQARAPIQSTEGFHDLYLVYRKPGASGNLFVLVSVGLVFDQKATASR